MSAANELNINIAHVERIAGELKLRPIQVGATAKLLADGATVPFISRYRKEATGELDEVQIQYIQERMGQLVALDDRRAAIAEVAGGAEAHDGCAPREDRQGGHDDALEDIRAVPSERRTKATIAKEKGLEPLADFIEQNVLTNGVDLDGEAAKFVSWMPRRMIEGQRCRRGARRCPRHHRGRHQRHRGVRAALGLRRMAR